MQRPVTTLRLSPQIKVKVLNAGFQTLDDVMQVSALELSREAGLSQEEALEVLQVARKEGGADGGGAGDGASLTALDLLQKEEALTRIVTFSSRLDAALGGGLPVGKITEICGVPGMGKTQLCLQLAVDVQVPPCFGGLGGQVVFIDTEGSFVVQRAVDLATAAVRHCTLLAEEAEQRDAAAAFTVETILSNIFMVRCHDYVELLAEIYLLPDFLSSHPKVRLVVIDSVAFPFRQHFDELRAQRTRLLNGLAQQLISMATKHDVAVVLSNQMTTRLQGGQSQLVPALGESWGHAPTLRLLLRWAGSQRQATIFKSPDCEEATVNYQITTDGFRDDDRSEQPPSKRPRTLAGQSAAC
ncbi:DNA repair protein RAD51 homolog 3 [Hippocampus comes]|uniref:DNA repair protein RAD51 homolog 3 n=1 Tax=Hippocampus comes TaxID=109280 RepID=A0A3Q2YJP1_HIPCM|nr:PREDICTED: DNA repair protein RAD51 homolog 3 [Hippocampus comes]XP_019716319.1 PREDICTED: DNA repair protein RAD51 homolog 3 [Hippocampus comes]XP_019716320.1 PREDICTED: DNA repair protein RAD51 homolog 3 [Hippocampus comes]